jgi:hypothetical protein
MTPEDDAESSDQDTCFFRCGHDPATHVHEPDCAWLLTRTRRGWSYWTTPTHLEQWHREQQLRLLEQVRKRKQREQAQREAQQAQKAQGECSS